MGMYGWVCRLYIAVCLKCYGGVVCPGRGGYMSCIGVNRLEGWRDRERGSKSKRATARATKRVTHVSHACEMCDTTQKGLWVLVIFAGGCGRVICGIRRKVQGTQDFVRVCMFVWMMWWLSGLRG